MGANATRADQTGSKPEISQFSPDLVSSTLMLVAVTAGSGFAALVVVWLTNSSTVAVSAATSTGPDAATVAWVATWLSLAAGTTTSVVNWV